MQGGQDTSVEVVDKNGDTKEKFEYGPFGKASVYDAAGALVGPGAFSGLAAPSCSAGLRASSSSTSKAAAS